MLRAVLCYCGGCRVSAAHVTILQNLQKDSSGIQASSCKYVLGMSMTYQQLNAAENH